MSEQKEANSWFKKIYQADIVELCNALGIELRNEGRTFRGVDHDSLVITPTKNAWYQNSRQIGGVGGWSFIKNYVLAEQNFDKATLYAKIKEIANKIGAFDNNITVATEQKTPYVYPQEQIVNSISKAKKYLVSKRQIKPQLVDWLHKHNFLDQDQNNNIIFKRLDPFTGKIIGASKQGTYIDYDKYPKRGTFKGIDPNSSTKSAWYFDIGQPENVRFFESPIDAMSYYQLEPDKLNNTRFIALDGLKPHVANLYLTITDTQLAQVGKGIKSIALGVDNDEAGDNFIEKMKEYSFTNNQGEPIPITAAQPNKKYGKDWNDQLKKTVEKEDSSLLESKEDDFTNKEKSLKKDANKNLKKETQTDITKKTINDLMSDVRAKTTNPKELLDYLLFLNKFHNYSFRNRLLIERQRSAAVAVGSFQTFKKLGYSVKRGEKGIKIVIPREISSFWRKDKDNQVRAVGIKYATPAERAQIKAGKLKVFKKTIFTRGTVFDVTQTTMPKEKYPELYPNRHIDFKTEGNQKHIFDRLDSFANQLGFKVDHDISDSEYSNNFGNAKGVTIPTKKAIYLNPNDTKTEKVTTLIHELGHAQLHSDESIKSTKLSKSVKELQAQLTSYLVAKNYGIDNHDYTVDYIASWTDNARTLKSLDPSEQAAIFGGAIKAADKVIDFVGTKDQILEKAPLSKTLDNKSTYQKKNDEKTTAFKSKTFSKTNTITTQELEEDGLELE